MSDRARRWLAAAALWAAALVVVPLAGRWSPDFPPPADLVVSTAAGLPAASVNSVTVSDNGALISATGPDPFLVLEQPARAVRSVRLEILPVRINRTDFYLYFVPAQARAGSGFSAEHVLAPDVTATAAGWRIQWELPEAVRAYRLDVPDDVTFRVVGFAASATAGSLAAPERLPRTAFLFMVAALMAFGGAVVMWPSLLPREPAIKRLAIGLLLLPVSVILFLLPPFQGPDEGAHWKLALATARPGILAEPSAYLLPEVLDPVPMRFKREVKFDPARLHIESADRALTRAEFDADQRLLYRNYPYARLYAYPAVTALAWLYPRIDGVSEALLLFYLCRIGPALLLIALLLLAQRHYDLPFTAIAFFSLPLVLQQSAVVSADVFLNIGALACALLYLSHREQPRRAAAVPLWLLTLSIVGVKFIYAPLLLLPALTIPAGRPRRIAVAAVAVLGVVLAYPAIRIVLGEVRAIAVVLERSGPAEQQIASLTTAAGWADLLTMYGRYAATLPSARAWSGPLGWLDTPLSDTHVLLISVSIGAAVALDLWRWAPQWRVRAPQVGFALAFGLAGTAVTAFVDVLLYYLMMTAPGATDPAGVQVRHFFPIAIAAVVLAAGPMAEDVAGKRTLLRVIAIATFVGLLVIRTVLLAKDLLIRYW